LAGGHELQPGHGGWCDRIIATAGNRDRKLCGITERNVGAVELRGDGGRRSGRGGGEKDDGGKSRGHRTEAR